MDGVLRQRGLMALVGALAGLSLYGLGLALAQDWLGDRPALMLPAFAGTFFAALLAMAGPMPLPRAAAAAAGVALAVALLLGLASLRYDSAAGLFDDPLALLAASVLALIPLPFLIAQHRTHWRHYPTLFTQSWGIVVRCGAAWLFVALVWAVILLSHALLGIVGITLIGDLIDLSPLRWLITGSVLGAALAVVDELGEVVSPYLILRLLRLLLPAVLLVMVVFIVALPIRGFAALFGVLSAALTMLTMAGIAATLVTTAIDQTDASAVQGPLMRRATQALALIQPIPGALGAWAVWLRVSQYGLTPNRIFAGVIALLGLGYGLLYALSVLRGSGWMARIRQANIVMALALVALSALWLTPLLDAPALSARSQLARYEAGQTNGADPADFAAWGRAGAAARARLQEIARLPGQEALAARLAADAPGQDPQEPGSADDLRAALVAQMPLQPATATATRDQLLAGIGVDELAEWRAACTLPLAQGGPGCVMVIADLWPDVPGEEGLIVLRGEGGWVQLIGLADRDGFVIRPNVLALSGRLPDLTAGEALIARLQAAPPALSPAPLNQIEIGGDTVILSP